MRAQNRSKVIKPLGFLLAVVVGFLLSQLGVAAYWIVLGVVVVACGVYLGVQNRRVMRR